MGSALDESTREALRTPWILDCDTTIKPLYGRQDGAEVSYNPKKPGRPSHAIHTYWVGNVRLVRSNQDHDRQYSSDHIRSSAPQLPNPARWTALVRYIVAKIIAAKTRNYSHHPSRPCHRHRSHRANRGI